MANNIPLQNLHLFLSNEVWTDILNLLSRRILVQIISPVCYRFKEISNKNVKNVHVITEAYLFCNNLRKHDLFAMMQLWHLEASKCPLASQFRLAEFYIFQENMEIVKYCPDLFAGCRIVFESNPFAENEDLVSIEDYLTHFQPTKPTEIFFDTYLMDSNLNLKLLLRHPTIWNCALLSFELPSASDKNRMSGVDDVKAIFDWLHDRPFKTDTVDDVEKEQQAHRCLILITYLGKFVGLDALISLCVEHFKESRNPEDRRQFVLCFHCTNRKDLHRRIENQATGEVLMRERVIDDDGRPTYTFRLRRCLANEIGDNKEFNERMFKRSRQYRDEFNIDEGKTTKVIFP